MKLPSLNTDQWIQLGMLAAAGLTLTGGALAAIRAWHKHRRRVSVLINQVPRAPVYVHGISFPDNEAPGIRSVGIWIQVEIHNNSERPVLVTGVENTNGESAPEPIIGWPIKELSFEGNVPTTGGIVDLPLRLEEQGGVKIYVLSKVSIPEPVGKLLFKVYGTIDPKRLEQAADKMAAELTASLSPKMKKVGVLIEPLKIAFQNINAPLLRKVDGKLTFEPKFGVVPLGAGLEVLANDPECAPMLFNARPLQHSLDIVLGDKKRIVRRLKSGKDPLWMLHK